MNSGNHKKRALLDDLDKLGYGLFRPEEKIDLQETLKSLVESNDPRLCESFPIVIYNCSMNKNEPNYCDFSSVVKSFRENKENREAFLQLLYLSLLTFKLFNEKEHLASDLNKLFEKKHVLTRFRKTFDSKFVDSSNVDVGNTRLNLGRMKNIFLNFLIAKEENEQKTLSETLEFRKNLQTELFLSRLFPPKQKEIIKKKLRGEKLNRSEAQYYSRVIKKRLKAIADDEVHKLAGSLIGKL